MMIELKIFIDRLKDAQEQKIAESIDSKFLDISELDLVFEKPFAITGKAYLAGSHLIISLKVSGTYAMPCSVCNEMAEKSVSIQDFLHTVEIDRIKGAVYNCLPAVREAILLQIPQFIECGAEKCPERNHIGKFLKESEVQEETYFPFASLTDD